ncbi:hypothetical protein BU16DRAFT_531294 [Lophium mytilinum]|uniref:Uncharacterized protein n=1 Tax=Lophium mytilinum TaxID=390894 RepID=A0A6A6QCP3_9PEZI|nr:hypothetical protein BU16DRAFT_531294 [Lophium mytilinum]
MTRPRVSLARRRTANESSQGQGPRNTGAPNAAVTINASSVNGNTINVSPPSNSNTTDNSGGVRLSYRTENRRRRRSSTPPEVEGLRTSSSEVAVETPQRPARRARYSSPTVDHVLQPQSRPASQPAPILRPFAPTRVRPDPPTTTEVPRQSATSAALLSVLDTPRPVHQPSATSRVLESILNTHIPTAPGATPIRWAASIPGVPEHRPTADEFVEMHRRQELWASGNPVRTPFTRHELHNRRMQNMEYWRIEQHQEQFVNRPPVPPIVTEERRGRRVPILQTQPLVQPSPNYRFPRMGPRLTAAQMRPHRPEGWTRPRVINLRNETPYDRMEFYENERRAKEDKDRRRLEAQQPGLRPPPNLLPDTPEGFANLRWAVEQGSRENVTMQLLEQVRAREEANRASFSGAFETFRRKMEAETKLERDEERTAERHASLHRDEDVALARDLREQRALQNAASGAEALEELRLEASMVWWEAAETAREREARRTGWIRVAADAARAASERIVERSARNRMNQLEAERRERARRTIEAYERRSRAANCQG